MTDKFHSLFNETQLWAENAADAGWIKSEDVERLKETQEVKLFLLKRFAQLKLYLRLCLIKHFSLLYKF